jgi:hypothetical protein
MAHMNYFITVSLMEHSLKVVLLNLEMNLGKLIAVCSAGLFKVFGNQDMTVQISIMRTDRINLLLTNLKLLQQPMTGVL